MLQPRAGSSLFDVAVAAAVVKSFLLIVLQGSTESCVLFIFVQVVRYDPAAVRERSKLACITTNLGSCERHTHLIPNAL